jgi:hypothetical protein
MRAALRPSVALAALVLGACSGEVDPNTPPANDKPDARPGDPVIDGSTPDTPDAAPSADARTDRYRCRGEALPTSAPGTIRIAGTAATIGPSGPVPKSGVTIEVFKTSGGSASPTTTTGGDGTYSLDATTGGAPLDGFARARAQGLLDTDVYPAAPFAADAPATSFILVTSQQLGLLAQFGGVQRQNNTAVLSLGVVDCDNKPVAGAKVTVPGGRVVYTAGGRPDSGATETSSDGVAFVFNVPAGNVDVSATADDDVAMRSHRVNARADVITATSIAP